MGSQWTAHHQSGGEKNERAVVCSAKSGWTHHCTIPLFVEQWRDVGEMSASGLQTMGTVQLPDFYLSVFVLNGNNSDFDFTLCQVKYQCVESFGLSYNHFLE
ncbi:hypothetical protein ABRP92_16130 [Pectobacterium aroidearum]|uniref:hypothetical protein n=1 Tax=Pectobacterium aroidearum TaxID=1201031 RepID=UPI0032F055B4